MTISYVSNNNDEIEVHRRREGSLQGPSGRADAPQRRRPDSSGGGSRPPSDIGSGGGGGTGGIRLPWWAILLLIVAYGIYSMIGGNNTGSQTAEPTLGQAEPSKWWAWMPA